MRIAPNVIPCGTVWSVGDQGDRAVVIGGPFDDGGLSEYLAVPLYSVTPAYVWTEEDMRLTAAESGLGESVFAAIWNARPVNQSALRRPAGTIAPEPLSVLQGTYWADLCGTDAPCDARLGRPVNGVRHLWARRSARRFRAAELQRWLGLLSRVPAAPVQAKAIRRYLEAPAEECFLSFTARVGGCSLTLAGSDLESLVRVASAATIRDDLVPRLIAAPESGRRPVPAPTSSRPRAPEQFVYRFSVTGAVGDPRTARVSPVRALAVA